MQANGCNIITVIVESKPKDNRCVSLSSDSVLSPGCWSESEERTPSEVTSAANNSVVSKSSGCESVDVKIPDASGAPLSAGETVTSSDLSGVVSEESCTGVENVGSVQSPAMLLDNSSGDKSITSEEITGNIDGQVVEVKVIPVEMLYDGTLWSQFDLTKPGDEEIFSGAESITSPITISDGVSDVARQVEISTKSDNLCLSIRDITKREKDRIKKRELRADPLFREREKVQAKQRMQRRRLDPFYREQERQRDKERRQLARRRNHTMRERERERDKEYKKHFRYGHKLHSEEDIGDRTVTTDSKSVDILPCHEYETFIPDDS